MFKQLTLATALFIISYSCTTAQSGWVRALDGYFVQLSASTFSSDKYYQLDGTLLQSDDKFSSENILLYGEYGAFDRVTILFNMPILKFHRYDYSQTVTGVGDMRFGFRYALSKSLPFALSFEAEVPLGPDLLLASAKSNLNPRADVNLPTGDGEYNFWTTLALSQSNPTGRFYGSGFVSFNLRSQEYAHQINAGIEAGYKPIDQMWIIARLGILESLGTTDANTSSFLLNDGTGYTNYGLTIFYDITKHLKFTAGYQNYNGLISKMVNVSDGATFNVGLALEY